MTPAVRHASLLLALLLLPVSIAAQRPQFLQPPPSPGLQVQHQPMIGVGGFGGSSGAGGSLGCVVTKNRLYSNGHYIRDLRAKEMEAVAAWKQDMQLFRQKIEEAFAGVEEPRAPNTTLPPVPRRPAMPAFCTAPDTTLYIFAGCTVQNYKIYVGRDYARDLEADERRLLDAFARLRVEESRPATHVPPTTPPPPGQNATVSGPYVIPLTSAQLQKKLDFCTEF